jgi:glycosyltransferase involved in cell wall biosynthesis
MHIALIVDEERLVHEQYPLNRLSIGLIGEGVRLTRIVPDVLPARVIDEDEQRMALATRLAAPMKVLPWVRRERSEQLVEAMEKGLPDVLYALGADAWALGLDLARRLTRPLVIDIFSPAQIRSAPRGRGASCIAGYVAPTRPMAEALRHRVDPGLVCLVPPGVAAPPEPRAILPDPERSIALAVIGGGRDVPAYRALLGGLNRIVRQRPQTQIILELAGPREHEIWRYARQLELLENVSAITDASQHRALLTRCDMLLMPERYGELRSIMLEAMVFGMPVVAAHDPYLDMLVDGESASIVPAPEPEEWARRLEHLLGDPEAARALGLVARERIASRHRSSDHVARLLETFERIVRGGAFPFDAEHR